MAPKKKKDTAKANKTEYIHILQDSFCTFYFIYNLQSTHVVSLSPIFGAIAFLCAVH